MTSAQHSKMAKVVALLTLVVVVAIAVGIGYLGPKILSSKDAADLSSCRAEFSADLNDARWEAVFDLIRADTRLTAAEREAVLAPIDEASERYRRSIADSQRDPSGFLERCRK